jgi:hypothetical protein
VLSRSLALETITEDPVAASSTGAIEATLTGAEGAVVYSLESGAPQSSGRFTGLTAGTYRIRATEVVSGCYREQDVVLESLPCPKPTEIVLEAAAGDSAVLSWSGTAAAVRYQVRWRVAGTGTWTAVNVRAPQVTLRGLSAGGRYEIRVRTDCGGGEFSAFTPIFDFTQPEQVR